MPIVARMTPELVYRPLTGEWPLFYQWWIPKNKELFKLEVQFPAGNSWYEMTLVEQNIIGGERIVTLAKHTITWWTPAGIWKYRLTLENESAITTLAVVAYTYDEVLVGDTATRIACLYGPGWKRTTPNDRSWATREFASIAVTAIERAHFLTRCDRIDLMDWSGPNGAPIPGHTYHQKGITLDGRYVRKENGEIDKVWFTELVNQTRKLTSKPFKYWINDLWFARVLLPYLQSNYFAQEVQAIANCLQPSDQYGGHKDHWHLVME